MTQPALARRPRGGRHRWIQAVACGVLAMLAGAGVAQAQMVQVKLTDPEATPDGGFGMGAVALSGDTVLVGDSFDDDKGYRSGAAYVFTRTAGVWTLQAKLTAPDGAAEDLFGSALAIDGDTAVIAARWDDDRGSDSGSVYAFTRTDGVWTLQAKLTAADGGANDHFGESVAVSGDTVVVGTERTVANNNSGAVHVFTRTGGVWSQQATLMRSADEGFGPVAVSGDTIVFGAPGFSGFNKVYSCPPGIIPPGDGECVLISDPLLLGSGGAYVFTRTGGVWTHQAVLIAHDAAFGLHFGLSVGLSGDTVVVGAPRADATGTDAGAAYVFTRTNGTWRENFVALGVAPNDLFGSKVAVSGDTVVVSAPGAGPRSSSLDDGAAYLFTRRDGAWFGPTTVLPADDLVQHFSQGGLALSGDTLVASAQIVAPCCEWAAYVFSPGPEPTGSQGPPGPQGEQGVMGPQGPAGADGLHGTNGADGAPGPPGPQGPAGQDGVSILSVPEPAGVNCSAGGFALTPMFSSGGVAGPVQYVCNGVAGADGAIGAQGRQGEPGAMGPAGANGLNGATGTNGTNGVDGAQGPQGPAGMQVPGSLLLMLEGVAPPPDYVLVGTFVEERIDGGDRGGRRPIRVRVVMWRKR
jgi:hypothetical protein